MKELNSRFVFDSSAPSGLRVIKCICGHGQHFRPRPWEFENLSKCFCTQSAFTLETTVSRQAMSLCVLLDFATAVATFFLKGMVSWILDARACNTRSSPPVQIVRAFCLSERIVKLYIQG